MMFELWRIKSLAVVLLLVTALAITGCAAQEKKAAVSDSSYMKVIDDAGREVNIKNKPTRVISLSPSFLEPLHTAGLNVIARPSSKHTIPEFAVGLPEIGVTTSISVEQVASLQPDLVVGYAGIHDKLATVLEGNNIPVLILKMKTYDEVIDKLQLFGNISGDSSAADAAIAAMQHDMSRLTGRLPLSSRPRAAILHSTAKSVSVLLEGSIAGSTAKLLNIENIATGQSAVNKAQDTVPFSLEKLVDENPDIIFVVAMGDVDEIQRRMDKEFTANPAWNSLTAVQQQHIYYLPQELFLLNPGVHYPQAAAVMARLAYPEVFGDE